MPGTIVFMTSALHIRPAGAADRHALRRLAALDDAEPVTGEVVMAFTDGEAVAAMSTTDGRVVADPFHYTAEAVALMRHYAGGRSRAPRGRLRFAGLHRLATG
jgi:hypothetical protein